MKGSEFMRHFIAATEAIQTEAILRDAAQAARVRQAIGVRNRSDGRRDGRQLAHEQREQLLRLSEIRIELEASRQRDTVDAALRELARLIIRRTPQRPSPRTSQRMPQQAARSPRIGDDVELYTIRRRGR